MDCLLQAYIAHGRSVIRWLLLLALLSTSYLQANESQLQQNITPQKPLHWGYVHFPPFTFTGNQKEVDGFIADMAKQILQDVQQPFTSFHYPNRRLFAQIADGAIDFGLFTRSVIGDSPHYLISRSPLSTTELRVYWLGEQEPITQRELLTNQRVILISGYSYGSLRDYVTNPDNRVRVVANVEDHARAFDLLRLGRGDYLLSYRGPSEIALKQNPIEGLNYRVLDALDIYMVLNANLPNAEDLMLKLEKSQQRLFPMKAQLD